MQLEDGGTVAYLADIAGHGATRHLMGMLKAAASRPCSMQAQQKGTWFAITHGPAEPCTPDVKSRRCMPRSPIPPESDGSIFYALAAQPPILHYRAETSVRLISTEQFPLGLLQVSGYSSDAATTASGDLLIAVTDGILEAANEADEEFGLDRLQSVIARHAAGSLPALAHAILEAARAFGKQIDDQTLLLIRRL